MPQPSDHEFLLAAWNAIGPSQPFPHEVEGMLLSYFKHVEMHGESTRSMLATEQPEMNSAPPTRFVRQVRTNKKASLEPAGASPCPLSEKESTCMIRTQSTGLKSDVIAESHLCRVRLEKIAKGLRAPDCN
jgi:hypothetical protein